MSDIRTWLHAPGTEIVTWGRGTDPGVYQVSSPVRKETYCLSGLHRDICRIDGDELLTQEEFDAFGEDEDDAEEAAEEVAEERAQELARRISALLRASAHLTTEEIEAAPAGALMVAPAAAPADPAKCFLVNCPVRECFTRIYTDDGTFDEVACPDHSGLLEKLADATLAGAKRHNHGGSRPLRRKGAPDA